MREVLCPKSNVNDETVVVVEVYKKDGSYVKEGDIIVDVETSKENIEIVAPESGYLVHSLIEGIEIAVGSTLFKLVENSDKKIDEEEPGSYNTIPNVKFSKGAIQKAKLLHIDLNNFKSGLIGEKEIEDFYNKQVIASKNDIATIQIERYVSSIKPNSIIIYGAGGHAKMCIDILRLRNDYHILGIVDDVKVIGSEVCGIRIIGRESVLRTLRENGLAFAINGVGAVTNPRDHKVIYDRLKSYGFSIPNLIHPYAVVEPSVIMGEGNQIMMGACVGSETNIGNNCIVNSGAIISHDSKLHDHCQISPGAILAGSVSIGECSVVGMGVTIYIGKMVGKNSVIYNGVHVFRNVKDDEVLS